MLFKKNILLLIAVYLLLTAILIISFAPLYMPVYVLTNGEKTVIFYSMIHVAEKKFYKQIEEELIQYKSKGYTYVYEGVEVFTKGQQTALEEAFHASINDRIDYSNRAGLISQPELNHLKDSDDIHADISANELLRVYDPEITKILNNPTMIPSLFSKLHESLSRSALRQNIRIYRYIFPLPKNVRSILIDYRDKKLYESIKTSKKMFFVIHYGEDHFNGFYNLLKTHDPRWKITNKKYLRAF